MKGTGFLALACGALLIAAAFVTPVPSASADTLQSQIDAQNQVIVQLNAQIAQYEAEIQAAEGNKKTLQAAIAALNLQVSQVKAQISATQHQITSTQLQIEQLGTSISATEDQISANQAGLEENIRSLDEAETQPLIEKLFSNESLAQFWTDADAVVEIQGAVQDHVDTLETQKAQLALAEAASQQKQQSLQSQKQTLTSQQQSLAQTTNSKAALLQETNAQESTYQKLLAEAQAQLTSFSAFAANAGGAGLLTNQTSCDSWGCYYNQRDAQWGNMPINGTKYLLKSDGCLVTSLAMVMTHYGYTNVTPVAINSNPGNFATYFPAYLLYTIEVDGVSATRKTATIDATLATGNPVIVGLYAYGGTHYVVLTSGSNGNYLMRDPYQPNAKDIPFKEYYKIANIFGVNKVVITG